MFRWFLFVFQTPFVLIKVFASDILYFCSVVFGVVVVVVCFFGTAYGILAPPPGMEPGLPAVEAWNPNH